MNETSNTEPTIFGLPVVVKYEGESSANSTVDITIGTYCRNRGCVKADGHGGKCWPYPLVRRGKGTRHE